MNKEHILWTILNSIFLIVFNVFFFALNGTDNVASVWISFAFIHFAYIMLLLTPKLIRSGKSSAVFGFSIYYVSSIYFLLQLVAGITFIIIAPESNVTAVLVQISIAMFYSIILVSLLIANERTADSEAIRQTQIIYIKDISSKTKELLDTVKDKDIKKPLERLYDTLYSSPTKSHNDLRNKEEDLLDSVNELESLIGSGDKERILSKINTLTTKINERNRLLKSLNI